MKNDMISRLIKNETVNNREYMVGLMRRHSVTALCCGLLTLALAFYAITAGVIKTITIRNENGFYSFIYFTMLSNTLAALSVAFTIPFAVEGIRKNRFTVPGWTAIFHFMSTTCITVTMVFVLAFMSWVEPEDAFGGANLFAHVFCPLLILTLFLQMETGYIFTLRDRLISIIPFCIYMTVYYYEVVLVSRDAGGWPDIYHITEYAPPFIAIPLLLLIAFGTSSAIAAISNLLTKRWFAKMFRYWDENADPLEVRIEAFGLGRMIGTNAEKHDVYIPFDLLEFLAKKYGLKDKDVMKPFMKGLLDELERKH